MQASNNVYISRTFQCSPEDLFKWIIEPKLFVQWFGPRQFTVCHAEMDARPGGSYQIGMTKPDRTTFTIEGEYLEFEHGRRLVLSFRYLGLNNSPPESIVEFILEAAGKDMTKLSFVQRFELMPDDMEKRTETWCFMLDRLKERILHK